MEINLDFEKESMDILKLKQQDDRTLIANIFSDSVPFDLAGSTVKVNASNYLGQAIIQTENIAISGNKVTINLIRDITRVAGMTKLELSITKTNKQLTTFTFYLDVKQSVLEGANLEVSIVADIIEVLTTKIDEAVKCKAETEQLIKTGNAATKGDVANLTSQLDSIESKENRTAKVNSYELKPLTELQGSLNNNIFTSSTNVSGYSVGDIVFMPFMANDGEYDEFEITINGKATMNFFGLYINSEHKRIEYVNYEVEAMVDKLCLLEYNEYACTKVNASTVKFKAKKKFKPSKLIIEGMPYTINYIKNGATPSHLYNEVLSINGNILTLKNQTGVTSNNCILAYDNIYYLNNLLSICNQKGIRELYFGYGTYTFSDNITLNSIGMRGQGKDSTFIKMFKLDTCKVQLEGNDIVVSDFTLTHSANISTRHDNIYGFYCYRLKRSSLKNIMITNSNGSGIMLNNCLNIEIYNNDVFNTNSDGISATSNSCNINIYNNVVKNNKDDSISVVSYLPSLPCSNIYIYKNDISGSTTKGIAIIGGKGIYVYNNTSGATSGANISMAVESRDGYQINNLEDVYVYSNIFTSSNSLEGSGYPFIQKPSIHVYNDSLDKNKIKNIFIHDNTSSNSNYYAVRCDNARNINVYNNNLSSNYGAVYYLNILNSIFNYNVCNYVVGNVGASNILIDGCSSVGIKGNEINDSYLYGIRLQNICNDINIYYNTIKNFNSSNSNYISGISASNTQKAKIILNEVNTLRTNADSINVKYTTDICHVINNISTGTYATDKYQYNEKTVQNNNI